MPDEVGKTPGWVLTGPAFEILLKNLEAAGTDYLKLRERIEKLFVCNRVRETDTDELMDAVMDRAARRMEEGVEVRNPIGYITQVARFVLMEYWDSPRWKTEGIDGEDSLPDSAGDRPEQDEDEGTGLELRLECLETCADGLPPAERQRVIDYYYEQRRVKIDNRKRIAEAMGISLNNLRVRMHRTREKLEKCILECLKKKESHQK